ncbi:Fanconi anemia group M protein-like isoform X2 [Asterias amurensis]|uniref:Fanconi anemia group M protein-like isoform X2 n=1 Tax=Asterias amurensis TaxID=7602 RepID=UPI003AB62553
MKKSQQTLLHHFTSRATTSTSQKDDAAQARNQPQVNLDDLDNQNFDDDMFLAACQDWEEQTLADPRNEGSVDRTGQGSRVSLEQSSRPAGHQQPVIPQATQLEDLPGFDVSAGNIWIYPTNYPVREYQFNIVQRALFRNTMVTLPTGLGKTFVAAVVMYNFYRWYPEGKVIFMAPTKPLVAQQIEACYNVMGIPQTDMAEMTGNMPPVERKKAWQRCRVFFLTPQVLMNDLSRRACPTQQVKCLVVDEAHKALGNHAYCQVIRELYKYSTEFRVLALSATPGSDLKAVQQVLTNLLISHIEIRSEESIDIQRYVHERKVEKVVVPLDDLMKSFRDRYLKILSVYIGRLNRCGALYNQDPATLTKFQILKSREAFRQDPPSHVKATGAIEGDYALSISLYHGFELLLQHGLRSLYNFLQSTIDGAKGFSRTRQELMRNMEFTSLMDTLKEKFGAEEEDLNRSRMFSPPGVKESKPYVTSHPKMAKLQEVVLQHFRNFSTVSDTDNPSTSKQQQQPTAKSTRVMIFAQYRDSVNEIAEMLNRHRPLLRCMGFVGQASSGKNSKGISQKEQLRVVKEFREGGYNTLVSTCVGEEGLDIGDVDLIVCYDAHKSPIRLVQRMGRTGRKRQGRIVMLVTEGKEAAVYDRSQYNKKGIHKALQGNAKSLQLYPNSPRMVPRGIDPQPHKMFISVQAYVNKKESKRSSSSASRKSCAPGIDTLLLKAKSDKKSGEFLSAEELAYWSANFKLDPAENASLPAMADNGHFLTLASTKKRQPSKRKNSRSELSLTEWSPWQMHKQPIRFVQHSQRCNQFVELMEFIDLQNLTEGEDIYGLEMQTYLDEEDIIKPKRQGIEQFCTRVSKDTAAENARSDNVGPDDEGSVSKKSGQKKSKKKNKPLEFVSSPSNSDNDNLPDVFMEANTVSKIPLGTPTEKHGTVSDPANQITSKTNKPRKHKQKLKHLKTKLDSSDDDDFEVADNKQEKSPGAATSGDTLAQLEVVGNKVQASEDEIKVFKKPRSPEYETPEPMDIDGDTPPTSPTFGKVSQSTQAALSSNQFNKTDKNLSIMFLSFPDDLDLTLEDDRNVSSGIRLWPGGKSSIPPPPPSLSSLDLLDDIDISVNLTQHFKNESNFFRSSKRQEDQPEIAASDKHMVTVGDTQISSSETSAEVMKDGASNSVPPHCDDSKNKHSSTSSDHPTNNDCSTAERDATEVLAGIKPNFDLNMDFTIFSDDDEVETIEQPQSDKEGNTPNDKKKMSEQRNEVEDQVSMVINNQAESIMRTPVAFEIETPQVESILFETDSRHTQKTLPVSSVHSPSPGHAQAGDANTLSQQGISNRRSLLGGNKRTTAVFSETPKSRRDSVPKQRPSGQLIRDRPVSTGISSKRELNLLEPQKMSEPVSCDGKAQVFDEEDTAEIERMRLQVLGSSEPIFDLGFDLDSLEEDEIEEHGVVPPSPDMKQQQEYINLSQVATQKEQPCSSQSRGMSSFWMRASSTPAQKTKLSLSSISCNEIVSPIAQYKQEKCNHVPEKGLTVLSVPQTEIFAGEKTSSFIEEIPQSLHKQVELSQTKDSRKKCQSGRDNSPAPKNLSRLKERPIIGKRKSSEPISTFSEGNPIGVKRRKSTPFGLASESPTAAVETDLVVVALGAKDLEMMTGGQSLEVEEFVSDSVDDKRVRLAPAPNVRTILVSPSKVLADSPDEENAFSQVVQHKKRRKAVVLESPEQPAFKTPSKPSNSSHKTNRNIQNVTSSSEDDLESPLIRRPKKRRQLNKMMISIDEDDEDFIGHDSRKKSVSEVKKKSCTDKKRNLKLDAQPANTKQKKTKKPRRVPSEARGFLAEEVEVSADEDCSSDEEGSDLDNSLEGFINNATQASQASQSVMEHSDMHAVYMQSVRTPHTGQIHPAQNRFKMVHRNAAEDDLDIFSQVPVQDESYYENSFVVREGEEDDFEEIVRKARREDDEDGSLFENTINPDNILVSKRRGRQKGLSKAAQILMEGRRKVLKTSSSSTSAEETDGESRRHDQRKPPAGMRKDFVRVPTCPQTSQNRNSGLSTQNTTGNSDKQASVHSAKHSVTDHTQILKNRLHKTTTTQINVQNKMTKDTSKDSQRQAGDSPTKNQPYSQGNISTSQGSVIRQFIEGDRTTVNSCRSDLTNGKQSTQQQSPVKSNSVPLSIGNDCLTLAEKEKAERLKRQEEKKREFLRRMEERKKQELLRISKESTQQVQHLNQPKPLHGSSSNNAGFGNGQTQLSERQYLAERTGATRTLVCQSTPQYSGIPKVDVIGGGAKAVALQNTTMKSPVKAQPKSLPLSPSSAQMTSRTTLAGSQGEMNRGKPVILVDSKELSSSSHIVSTLALRHNLNPIVSQLSGCDYIVSTRMGVEKRSMSDFGSSVNKNKLIDRVRHLCELFDRPCLILEKDRVKVSDAKNPKPMIRTKYLDSTLATLSMTHIKVLYSDSLEDTARILAELVRMETRKGSALSPPPFMDSVQEQVFRFYMSLPRVSFATAQSMMTAFPSIQQLINCSQEQLQHRAKISQARAKEILSFLHHGFDEQMTCLGSKR